MSGIINLATKNGSHYFSGRLTGKLETEFQNYCFKQNVSRLRLLSSFLILENSMLIFYYGDRYANDLFDFSINVFIGVMIVALMIMGSYIAFFNAVENKKFKNKDLQNAIFRLYLPVFIIESMALIYFEMWQSHTIYIFFITSFVMAFIPLMSKIKAFVYMISLSILTTIGMFIFMSESKALIKHHLIFSSIFTAILICLTWFHKNHIVKHFLRNVEDSLRDDAIKTDEDQFVYLTNELERIKATDGSKQLASKPEFDEYLMSAWHQCQRSNQPITVMMFDIDYFKNYNNRFGHDEGDKCLMKVTKSIEKRFKRSSDLLGKYGGEDFAAILPFTTGEKIIALTEEIRKDVEMQKIANPDSSCSPYVTISAGIASYLPTEDISPEDLVIFAKEALDEAKEVGRNRVVFSNQSKNNKKFIAPRQPIVEVPGDGEDLRKLHTIISGAMMAIFAIDIQRDKLELSHEILQYIDLDSLEVTPLENVLTYIHPEDTDKLRQVIKGIRETVNMMVRPHAVECRLKMKDGHYKWVSVKVDFVANGDRPTTIVGSITDASEIMRQQEIYKLMADGASSYLYSHDFATDTTQFSDSFKEELGLEDNVLQDAAAGIYKYIVKEDKGKFHDALSPVGEGKTDSWQCELRCHRADGGIMWLNCRGKVNRDINNKPILMGGSLVDITERVISENKKRLILEGSSDYVYLYDFKEDTIEFSQKIMDIANLHSPFVRNASETIKEKVVLPEDVGIFKDSFTSLIEGNRSQYATEFRIIGRNGEPVWIAARGKCDFDENGKPSVLAGAMFNLNSFDHYNQYLENRLFEDHLTGIPNRACFYRNMEEVLKDENQFGYILIFDVNNFKSINSAYSHKIGDQLLKRIPVLVNELLEEGQKIYNFGGDVFVVHMPNTILKQVKEMALDIDGIFSNGAHIVGRKINVTFSIGAVSYDTVTSVDELLINAEIAIQKVKYDGKNNFAVFSPEDKQKFLSRLELESMLRDSVENNFRGFEVYYQPLFSANKNTFVGAEALLRWHSPDTNEIIPPVLTIPCLDSLDMLEEVEHWVLESVARQCKKWLTMGVSDDFFINVNLCSSQISKDTLNERVSGIIERCGISPKNIILEITEDACVMEVKAGIDTLNSLQFSGFDIAIDDFGTGYSSLSYLRRLPVKEVKIDRSFIIDIEDDESNIDFVSSIIQLSHSMEFIVCVEGVETEGQLNILKKINADLLQGFLFSRPIPAHEFEKKIILGLLK